MNVQSIVVNKILAALSNSLIDHIITYTKNHNKYDDYNYKHDFISKYSVIDG